jgi:hypothetical protein
MKKKKSPTKQRKKLLNPKQELFCQLYVKNAELFGNATWSYAEAYGYKLVELSDERPKNEKGEVIGKSERQLAENLCAVEGGKLLRKPHIQDRLTALLNEMLKDEIVDRELAKVILQDDERPSKVAAIREYNKLKQRIIEKVDVTSKGEKVQGFQLVPPNASQDSPHA